MKTTIEISNYPLSEQYEERIIDFIERVKLNKDITVRVNCTSTHIVGEYDKVWKVLQDEIKTSFEKYGKMIFVVKFLNGELDLNY